MLDFSFFCITFHYVLTVPNPHILSGWLSIKSRSLGGAGVNVHVYLYVVCD